MNTPTPVAVKEAAPLPLTPLALPANPYAALAWTGGGLVVEYVPAGKRTSVSIRLALVDPANPTPVVLPIEEVAGCEGRTGIEHPLALADGRLGYVTRCVPANFGGGDDLRLMAYDFATQRSAPLRDEPLPWFSIARSSYTLNPTLNRGLGTEGSLFDSQAYWFGRGATTPVDLGLAVVRNVAWSPDGKAIAVIGAREQNASRPEQLDTLFGLYRLDPATAKLEPLAEGFRNAADLGWSPDSRWIVFPGQFGADFESAGLWAYNLASRERQLLASGHFQSPSWSPDGRSIAAVESVGDYPINVTKRIVVLDASTLR